jgi:excisionase family DNA binding protein
MFIHLHEPEEKPCDNCGNSQTLLSVSALKADQTMSLCRNCVGEAVPALLLVAKKLRPSEAAPVEKGAKLLTLKELAELLSVHECTIYRQLKAGRIPFVRVGGEYRFNPVLVIAKLTADTNRASLAKPRRRGVRAERRQTLRLVPPRRPRRPDIQEETESDEADRSKQAAFEGHAGEGLLA